MIFGELPLDEAEGALLAHSVKLGGATFKKGRALSAEDIAALREAGMEAVVAARLEAGDVHEDAAARRLAEAAAGPGAMPSAAFTGRCNLIAGARGLAVFDQDRLRAVNAIDEAITIATLPPYEQVEPRQMLATVKVIPFAVPGAALEEGLRIATEVGGGAPLVRVAPFRPRAVALVQTELPGLKASLLVKTKAAVDGRLTGLGCPPSQELRCAHDAAAVAAAVGQGLAQGAEVVLISGASAIIDRRDVVPAGVVAAGGSVEHFGMPVDPGNLMLLARKGAVPLIGLPGCARSPKMNGFDWVLQRLIADLPVGRAEITGMGVGGLLKEIAGRPLPRAGIAEAAAGAPRAPRIGAIVLAAGQSRRMGPVNKLLAAVEGEPMVRRALRAARESQAAAVVVVTGHEAEAVAAALSEHDGTTVHNPDYAKGLSTSLHAGLAALPAGLDGAVVLLGDMPWVGAATVDRLIAAFNTVEGRAICIPTWQGKRGNPVLFARRFFAELQEVSGDVGAKPLLANYPELVAEVPMDDDAALKDIDTPDQLA